MKRMKYVAIFILIALLSSAFAPAPTVSDNGVALAASMAKIKVKNQTGAAVWLTLQGAKTYYFNVASGNSTVEIEKGNYKYSYWACGKEVTGQLKNKDTQLVMKACGSTGGKGGKGEDEDASGGKIKITFNNQTGEVFWVTFKGKATVYHQAAVGKSTVELEKGNYTYSYFACAKQNEDSINVKKAETIRLKCGGSGGKDDDAKKGTVKIRIQNDTGGLMTMNLTGPETYSFQLPAGKQRINVIAGTYQYTVWACGGYSTGTEKLKGSSTWTWWCTP
ncbi:MAG: hypothetical protein JXB38_15965 [Anaerolineales bacterium]|nr:hypothetical protein [Anaerolineales bacterium]